MKVKLSYHQFTALYAIVGAALAADNSNYNMMQKMFLCLMADVYKKLYVKAIERKTSYTLKFKDAEAIAFWMLFNRHDYGNTSFEGNLLDTINFSIHQKYA